MTMREEPVGDIEVNDDGSIVQRWKSDEHPIPPDTPISPVSGFALGVLTGGLEDGILLELYSPIVDVPLRVALTESLSEQLISGLIDAYETIEQLNAGRETGG